MLNKKLVKQTLVATLLLAAPAAVADPPAVRWPVRGFGDWQRDCTATPCRLRTEVRGAGGDAVLALALLPGTPPRLELATTVPLYVPDPALLAIGAMAPVPLPWRTCASDGCRAETPATPELLAALRRERSASVTFTPADGVPVRVGISLVGFSAARRATP